MHELGGTYHPCEHDYVLAFNGEHMRLEWLCLKCGKVRAQ